MEEANEVRMVDGNTFSRMSRRSLAGTRGPVNDSAGDLSKGLRPIVPEGKDKGDEKDVEKGEPATGKADEKKGDPATDKADVPVKSLISPIAPKTKEKAVDFWQWMTMYRHLFNVVVAVNTIGLVLAATGHFAWGKRNAGQIAVANTLICVLVRNECFIRTLYFLMVKSVTIFSPNGLGTLWAPVWYRNLITNFLLHIGGLHSGCGVATILWLVYTLILTLMNNHLYHLAIVIVGFCLLAAVVISCVSAIPYLRFYLHDHFEHSHRYAGWSSIVILWAFLILMDSYDATGNRIDVQGGHFYAKFQFIAALITTFLVVLPWACVRRVPVHCEISPAKRITLIKFPGYVQPGLYGRISRGGLSEWHVFGCFSEHVSKPHHFMICSVVGSFTKALAEEPPKELYVRLIKFAGYSYCHRMYNKGIAICTGAAIGVFISLFSQGLTNFDLIWVGSKFEETYGSTVVNMLKKSCPGDRLTLYDTKERGRPVLTDLAADAFHKQKAEVVFCVSNLKGTRSIVNGCRQRGIPAFGPIWDA